MKILFINIISLLLIGNLENASGQTPLHQAVKGNDNDIIEDLIKKGSQMNPFQIFWRKALYMAKHTDCPGIVESVSSAEEAWHVLAEIEDKILSIVQDPNAIDDFYSESLSSESFRKEFTQFLKDSNVDVSSHPLYSNEEFPKIILKETLRINICSIPTTGGEGSKNLDVSARSWSIGYEHISRERSKKYKQLGISVDEMGEMDEVVFSTHSDSTGVHFMVSISSFKNFLHNLLLKKEANINSK